MNQPGPVREIDAVQAAALADSGRVLLLDVREDDEWTAGHAPGAVHTALGLLNPFAVPRDRPIIAVCRVGSRSHVAAQAMAAAGVDVQNLRGGMKAWAAAGLPVVRAPGGPGVIL